MKSKSEKRNKMSQFDAIFTSSKNSSRTLESYTNMRKKKKEKKLYANGSIQQRQHIHKARKEQKTAKK
jgi:uroporphyrinogen-III synthase